MHPAHAHPHAEEHSPRLEPHINLTFHVISSTLCLPPPSFLLRLPSRLQHACSAAAASLSLACSLGAGCCSAWCSTAGSDARGGSDGNSYTDSAASGVRGTCQCTLTLTLAGPVALDPRHERGVIPSKKCTLKTTIGVCWFDDKLCSPLNWTSPTRTWILVSGVTGSKNGVIAKAATKSKLGPSAISQRHQLRPTAGAASWVSDSEESFSSRPFGG
eukprot:3651226-Rhodomonas_salina.1